MLQHLKSEGAFSPQSIFCPSIAIAMLAAFAVGGISVYTVQQSRSGELKKAQQQVIQVPQVKTVTALGRLEPKGEVIKLSAPASAEGSRVEQLLVKEGDTVKAGQVVAILDSRDRLGAALEEAKEAVQVAKANLQQVKAGAKQGEIAAQTAQVDRLQAQRGTEIVAQKATIARLEAEKNTEIEAQKATIAKLQAELDNAQAEYQRYQSLYQEGAISASSQDSKRLTLQTAQQQLAEAKANLKRIQASRQEQLAEAKANLERIQTTGEKQIEEGKATLNRIAEVRPVDVAAAQAEVNKATAAVKRADANLQQAYVRSPQAGQVFKIYTRPGELVSNDGIAEIGQTGQMYAVVEVYQSDVNKVRPGQKVRLDRIAQIDQGKTVTTEIERRTITVSGLFKVGASFIADGSLITSDQNFLRLFPRREASSINLGLIQIQPGYDPQQVATALRTYLSNEKDVKVLTKEEFIKFEEYYWQTNTAIGFIFSLGVSMGFIVGVIIVYQVLSTDVNAHMKEYATFRAMGYRSRYLLGVVFEEAIIMAVLGFIPGFTISMGLYALTRSATNLPLYMTLARAFQVQILTVIMCMISGAIATRKVLAADPADMF
nr:ABC transporter permease DevC [Fischerella sp.]